MRRFIAAAVVFILPVLWSLPAGAAEYFVSLAHVYNIDHPAYEGALLFQELVEDRTGGRIEVEVFPGGQMGSEDEVLDAVRLGTLEAGLVSGSAALYNPWFKLLDAPFLFSDRDHAAQVLDGPLGRRLAQPLDDRGIRHLAYWDGDFRQITNDVRPLEHPDHLAGLTLATDHPVMAAALEQLGAVAVMMPVHQRTDALREGRIVGQEGPLAAARPLALQGLQRYLSISNHAYQPVHLVVNKAFWDGIPADLQGVLLAAAREAGLHTRRLGAAADRRLLDAVRQAGVTVASLERAAFVEAITPVWESLAQEVAGARALRLLKEMAGGE